MQKIIDGHVHLYPEKLMTAVLNWFEETQGWSMPYKWAPEKHIEFLRDLGIEEFMVLGYTHKAGISQGLNNWLADLAKQYQGIRPFACVHQDDDNKEEMIKVLLDNHNFFGVKIHCFVQKVSALDYRFEGICRLLDDRGKGLVLHASSMPISNPDITPEHVESLLIKYPNLKITVAHLGLPEYHKEYLSIIDRHDNLFLDTAYIFGNPNIKTHLLRDTLINYPDRIIYGSDFPVMDYSPEKSIHEIKSFNLGSEIEHKIFYQNAKSFMNIK